MVCLRLKVRKQCHSEASQAALPLLSWFTCGAETSVIRPLLAPAPKQVMFPANVHAFSKVEANKIIAIAG